MPKQNPVDELRELVGSEDEVAIATVLREFVADQQKRIAANSERRMVKVNKYLEKAADELFKEPALERIEPVRALLITSERRAGGYIAEEQTREHTDTIHDIANRLLTVTVELANDPAKALVELLARIDNGSLPVL